MLHCPVTVHHGSLRNGIKGIASTAHIMGQIAFDTMDDDQRVVPYNGPRDTTHLVVPIIDPVK